MTDVDWLVVSVVVGDQGALDRGAELPVEPDRGGQGGQPLGDAGPQAVDGVGAVAFQAELVFEGVEDRLDPLADPAQVAEPVRLITAVRAGQPRVHPATTWSNSHPARPLSARMTMPGAASPG